MVTLGGYDGRVYKVTPSGGAMATTTTAAAVAGDNSAPLALTVTREQGDPIRLTVDDLTWSVGLPLIRVTVDGKRQVLQFLGASGEVSNPSGQASKQAQGCVNPLGGRGGGTAVCMYGDGGEEAVGSK